MSGAIPSDPIPDGTSGPVPGTALGELPAGPILPRIKTLKFIQAAAELQGMTADQIPYSLPIAGDLLLSFSVDTGEQFIFLSPRECARRGLGTDALKQAALDNCRPLVERCQLIPHGDVHQLRTGQDMDACTLLLDEIWERLAQALGEAPVAIFPHRSLVCVTGESSRSGIAQLRQIVDGIDFGTTHALSRHLYRWSGGRWQVHEPDADQGQAAAGLWLPIDHYEVHEGLVRDTRSGLMWMRCVIGAGWDGEAIQGLGHGHTWDEAVALARGFRFAGYEGWRLPTAEELITLIDVDSGDDANGVPFIHTEVFGTPHRFRNARGVLDLGYHPGRIWTDAGHDEDDSFAWYVDFTTRARAADAALKSRRMGVRLVRG